MEAHFSPNMENDTPAVVVVNGTNMVAIDNKIEQAMDLVKTHLLYAVREEVEVLKERIIELESKIARLESENKLLRKHAPVEVIQFIQQQTQDQQPNHSASPPPPPPQSSQAQAQPQQQQVFNVLRSQLHPATTTSVSSHGLK